MAIAGALLLGQGLIMNIYYDRKQKINISSFWKEILKMDVVPCVVTLVFVIIQKYFYEIHTWQSLILGIFAFCVIYIPLFIHFSMNSYERDLIIYPILNKIRK